MSTFTIGVDIGGTHTDAVILNDQKKIVAYQKTATTSPLEEGFQKVLRELLKNSRIDPHLIEALFVGTTHATNAILEAKQLGRVGLIRISGQRPQSPTPGFGWPERLKNRILAGFKTIGGGFEFDGRPTTKFDIVEAREAVFSLAEKKVDSIAVIGSFALLDGQQELEVGAIISDSLGQEFPFTLSHQIGGMGFIERENATLLNSALQKVIGEGFSHLENSLHMLGLHIPLWMTQNNGSLLNLKEALKFPINTISAGPTNSFLGGARLLGFKDAVVVDIGGTSTDIGVVENDYARRSMKAAHIGGIDLNFSMPDNLSFGIGGGSLISLQGDAFKIGPQSVARNLKSHAQAFGGEQITLSDVGLISKLLTIPDADLSRISLDSHQASLIMKQVIAKINDGIRRMRGKKANLPVIIVGGAASLLQSLSSQEFPCYIPECASVANAYGAALAEVSFTVDTVVSLKDRANVLERLKSQAIEKAISNGACPKKTKVAVLSILPFGYSAEALARVTITASGERVK